MSNPSVSNVNTIAKMCIRLGGFSVACDQDKGGLVKTCATVFSYLYCFVNKWRHIVFLSATI